MQEAEEKEELALFMFKTNARSKMLAFKRIMGAEFPMRMIPLDSLETVQDDDGFEMIVQTPTTLTSDRKKMVHTSKTKASSKHSGSEQSQASSRTIYTLCFVNMIQIEAYLQAHGLLKGNDLLTKQ